MLTVGARLFLIAVAVADRTTPTAQAAPTAATAPTDQSRPTAPAAPTPTTAPPTVAISIRGGRTTTVVAEVDVGAPIERAVPSAPYARAATADAEERWEDAQPLYRQAIAEWTATARARPSRALELAIAKAEHELRLSQLLAFAAQNTRRPIAWGQMAEDARRGWQRRQALEEGRLLEAKLLSTRAALGRVPAALYTHARNRLEEARDADPSAPGPAGADGGAEIELLLCRTYAAGDAPADARLARARIGEAERESPVNALGVAGCAAALGQTEAALARLEAFILRPAPVRPDRLREIQLSNDWDRLRGNPRFESLFPR